MLDIAIVQISLEVALRDERARAPPQDNTTTYCGVTTVAGNFLQLFCDVSMIIPKK